MDEHGGWRYRENNPSWHRRPFSIYWRTGKYVLYVTDELVGEYEDWESADQAATEYMRKLAERIRKGGK